MTLDDVTPIARLTGEFEAIVVPAASPFQKLADLVAALKADPAKVPVAGGSAGGTDHILFGLIAKPAGVDPTTISYVPFSGGGEALAALLGNPSMPRLLGSSARIAVWCEQDRPVQT